MTTITASASGTASLSQLIANPPKNLSTPTVVGDGSVSIGDANDSTTPVNKTASPNQHVRQVTAEDLLDAASHETGDFLNVIA